MPAHEHHILCTATPEACWQWDRAREQKAKRDKKRAFPRVSSHPHQLLSSEIPLSMCFTHSSDIRDLGCLALKRLDSVGTS